MKNEIEKLNSIDIKTNIITGDHMYTTIKVANQLNFFQDKRVIICDFESEKPTTTAYNDFEALRPSVEDNISQRLDEVRAILGIPSLSLAMSGCFFSKVYHKFSRKEQLLLL